MAQLTTRSGAPVSRFVFGCMQWGAGEAPDVARATWHAARAAGITHFDTAYIYTDGRSETILGDFLTETDRDALYIATKVGNVGRASRANMTAQLEESLARLQLDQVDLLYLHRWDSETPLTETILTLIEAQQSGKTRHIGLSNFAAWQVMKAQAIAEAHGSRIDVIQPMLNLVKRQAEVEILPMARDQDITVCSYSPLGGGLLTGKYATGSETDRADGRLATNEMYKARYRQGWMAQTARDLTQLATREGTSPATLAIAWLARHAPEVSPILSARNADQLAASLAGMTYTLSDALYAQITELSQTPPPATDRLEEA